MHGGRVSYPATTGVHPVGPSAVAAVGEVFTPSGRQPAPVPRALVTAEVPEQARSYADAAQLYAALLAELNRLDLAPIAVRPTSGSNSMQT